MSSRYTAPRIILILLLVIPVGIMLLFESAFLLGSIEEQINIWRGYRLVTLKTRMYWDNGKVVAGEKVKTWQIAIPKEIWLKQNSQSWSLTSRKPIYSNRHEDLANSRYVTTMTDVTPDNTLVAYLKGGADVESYTLTFSNKIIGTTGSGADDYPSRSITDGCMVRGGFVNYRGWMVEVPPKEYRNNSKDKPTIPNPISDDERICAIVLKNLNAWTLHIDDLQSKDSGQ